MFNINKIWQMINIIRKNHVVFIAKQLGVDYLSDEDKDLLNKFNINIDVFKDKIPEIERAYYFGIMAGILGGQKSFKVTKDEFESWFKDELNKPQSVTRQNGIKFLKDRIYTDLSGIGNKVTNSVNQRILTANLQTKNQHRKIIAEKTIEAYEKNKTKQWLASELRAITEDWGRDWSRIADYVMQEAYGFGRAQQILEDYGADAKVYKQTFPGVCKHCEKNYGSPGEEPVIYDLQDLITNGNNIGRKEQLPVVGPAHPWARSILHVVQPNSVWNNNAKKFEIQRNKQGVQRKSKVKVTISQ